MQLEKHTSHCLYLAMLLRAGALKDPGEILELEVRMIFNMNRMQVIKESNRPKTIDDRCISAET